MGDIDFIHISNLDNVMLLALFLVSKMELVVSSVDGNESPRLDGFNLNFFIRLRNMLKADVEVMFEQFYTPANLLKIFS